MKPDINIIVRSRRGRAFQSLGPRLVSTQNRARSESGSALMLTVVIIGLIAIVLGSYLALAGFNHQGTTRSEVYNQCVPVLEAGIEEAIAHLNKNFESGLAVDGWATTSVGGTMVYTKTLTLDANRSYSRTTISNSSPPVIFSTAYVPAPLSSSGYVSRTVRVDTRVDALFSKAIAAKGDIETDGHDCHTDSYDSDDSKASTNGCYDESKCKHNGDVATNTRLCNSKNTGDSEIDGKCSTGPGKDSVSCGLQGTVTGEVRNDMNVSFRSVPTPSTASRSTPCAGKVNGNACDYVLSSGKYQLDSLCMNGSNKLKVTGDAELYVSGNVNLSGTACIEIDKGASLKLCVGGSSACLGGGGVVNGNDDCTKFSYYGLPSNKSVEVCSNAKFSGCIYAPDADLKLGRGGDNTDDFMGSVVGSTVKLNGNCKVHYDENLSRVGGTRGIVIVSWNEI